MRRQDLEILAQTSTQYKATLSAQAAETTDHEGEVASITRERDERAQHRDNVREEIKTIQKQIAQRQAAQVEHSRALDAQSRLNVPELDFWEMCLGMRIDGAGQADRISFVFSCIDEQDWNKEAWVELDTAQREYKVAHMKPRVEEGEMEALLERLNESRSLGPFLKGMREAFTKETK